MTHAYAHAHFSNKRVIRELRIVSCPGGGVWVAVTRELERDNCVTSEILQSDWTIPNRAGVPRKSTKVPRQGGGGGGGGVQLLRNNHPHTIYACIVYVRRYARNVSCRAGRPDDLTSAVSLWRGSGARAKVLA